MNLTLFTSGTTWAIIAMFIIGGSAAIGLISPTVATTLMGLIGASGLVAHNNQIKAGSVKSGV